tara:strand:+ start:679 stop:1308 length:630 start_codon:yes stop_codon:yes gene_type:complete
MSNSGDEARRINRGALQATAAGGRNCKTPGADLMWPRPKSEGDVMRRLYAQTVGLALFVFLAAGSAPTVVWAADPLPCVTPDEDAAFDVRHLQSRFMVAALACNQRDAYNEFVTRFRPYLMDAGDRLIRYFVRAGGGQSAINQHVTDLANAAGLRRAENPTSFCNQAWNLFWSLEQAPLDIAKIAAINSIKSVARPPACKKTVSGEKNG